MVSATDWRGALLEKLQPKPNRWPTPGAMAVDIGPQIGLKYKHTALHARINEAICQLRDGTLPTGDGDRLMIFCPPQEGKSTATSRLMPLWLLDQDPTLRIALMSFGAELATEFGRTVKTDIRSADGLLNIRVSRDSRAADRWKTEEGGGMVCVGRDGGLTGRPVDTLIIDDPFSSQQDAISLATRNRVWSWWESVGRPRLSSRGRVLLVNTRWHEDDLAGRLLQREPGRWHVLSIPAIAEADVADPLGRTPGTELKSAQGRKPGYFRDLKSTYSPFAFSAIYQQRPAPTEGGLFPRDKWRTWLPKTDSYGRAIVDTGQPWPLMDCMRFITMDLATSTKTSADYTVIAAWAITPDGNLVLLDRWRGRVEDSGHWDKARPLIAAWDIPKVYVESRMFGTTFVYAAGRAGLPLEELQADADKWTRAVAASQLQHQGRVWLPGNALWLDEFRDELASFDTGTHDDQVDVTAYAARIVEAHWLRTPAPDTWKPLAPPPADPLDRLFNPSGAADVLAQAW